MQGSSKPKNPIKDRNTILLLVKQVQQHPCLWDPTNPNYRSPTARNDAWNAIVEKIGGIVPIVRQKWKSLCCQYLRNKNELEKQQKQNPGTRFRPSWFAYNAMDFLANVKRGESRKGKTPYLIVGEEYSNTSNESLLDGMFDHAGCAEESVEHCVIVQDDILPATRNGFSEQHNVESKQDENNIIEYDETNGDTSEEDTEESLEKRYLAEKRKSDLLYDLNEKLEKDVAQKKVELQQQQLKIARLEQKLKQAEQQLEASRVHNADKANLSMEGSTATDPRASLFDIGNLIDSTIVSVSSPNQSVEGPSDPLAEKSKATFQLITYSLKKIQESIDNLTSVNQRRFSTFGNFMVSELNQMDELISLRLINEMTSMLQAVKSVTHNVK